MDGLLVVDKPVGPTSHDVVARVRRALRERRIGHTGTLDPAAGGVLPLVIGRATRLARFFSANAKRYEAIIRLGSSTDTGDAQGTRIGAAYDGPLPDRGAIDSALAAFRGAFLQRPPAYSAKMIDGHRSYALARAQVDVVPGPAAVTTHAIEILALEDGMLTLRIDCSAGFYVRSLAADLGERLGIGAHLAALQRTGSGDYGMADAMALQAIERDPRAAATAVVPMSRLLMRLASVTLTAEGIRHARNGCDLRSSDLAPQAARSPSSVGDLGEEARLLPAGSGEWIRMLDEAGDLLGLAHRSEASGVLHPSVVLM